MSQTTARIHPGFDVWNIDDKDVILLTSDQFRFANKKDILKCYLEKIGENLTSVKLEEENKRRLRDLHKSYQARALLISNVEKCEEFPLKSIAHYIETDADGNKYVSDDM